MLAQYDKTRATMSKDSSQQQKINNLTRAIASLKNSKEATDFLNDLCSRKEVEAMADRWAVVPYINEGLSYRQIHQATQISLTTIGRVANAFSHGSQGYKKILERNSK